MLAHETEEGDKSYIKDYQSSSVHHKWSAMKNQYEE